jgi:hypothetical protein
MKVSSSKTRTTLILDRCSAFKKNQTNEECYRIMERIQHVC